MPKISAATVAEHRTRQRAALIRSAIDILAEQGAAAATPAAVGARAGVARSTFYLYFPSVAALLAAIVEESFTAADDAVTQALASISGAAARIDAFVRTELQLAADGLHKPAAALMNADLPPECRERVHELHRNHYAPLHEAITATRPANPDLASQLIGGLLQAAMTAVGHGTHPRDVADQTLQLIHHGLTPAPDQPQHPTRQPHTDHKETPAHR
ncbi:MAG: TetR/AcrR family transcriptional regulator [Actinocrinis sp.]